MNQLITRSGGWQWSPDSSKVAFWVFNATALGYNLNYGLVIIDLAAQTFCLLETPLETFPTSPERWAWTPSGESLLVTHSDNQLFEMSLNDGSQTFVASEVSIVLAWYPTEQSPPSTACDTTIPASDTTSLIAAITSANGAGTPQTLCLTSSTYTLDSALPITAEITIVGDGATIEFASGSEFNVSEGGKLTLRDVSVHATSRSE